MDNLITPAEFAEFRKISKKIDEDKVKENISLAQENDLQNALGDFYFDLVKNYESAEYADLMNGSEFEYCGDTFIHHGIKKYFADLVFARFITDVNTNLNPFGITKKVTRDGEHVDESVIRAKSKQAQQDAAIKFRIIEKYLKSKPDLFERFCRGENKSTNFNSLKLTNTKNIRSGFSGSDVLNRRYNN